MFSIKVSFVILAYGVECCILVSSIELYTFYNMYLLFSNILCFSKLWCKISDFKPLHIGLVDSMYSRLSYSTFHSIVICRTTLLSHWEYN